MPLWDKFCFNMGFGYLQIMQAYLYLFPPNISILALDTMCTLVELTLVELTAVYSNSGRSLPFSF